jgi:hypothetical protein
VALLLLILAPFGRAIGRTFSAAVNDPVLSAKAFNFPWLLTWN